MKSMFRSNGDGHLPALSRWGRLGALALAASLAMPTSATRYFVTNGGDVSVAGNFSGDGNVYFQGGYNGASSAYLPEGKNFSSTVIVYVFNDFTLNIQGGVFDVLLNETLSASNPSFTVGKGVVNQSGGTVNAGPAEPLMRTRTLCLAYSDNGHAQYNLSGGTLNVRGDSLLMVRNVSPATFTQTGGVLDLSGGFGQAILLGESGSGSATVNLKGGVAKVGRFYSNIAAASYLNFDGGIVQPLADSAEFIGSASGSKGLTARVLAGGAVFDTQYDVTSCLPLVSGVEAPGVDGGLTKRGVGMLSLPAGNTYTGPTKIEAGTLKIVKGVALAGSLEIANGGKLLLSGVTDADMGQVVATFDGGISFGEGATAVNALGGFGKLQTFEVAADGKGLRLVSSAEAPAYATYDVGLAKWNFFSEDDAPMSSWDKGVTDDIWVHFATDAEYQAIKATGVIGRGLLLACSSLPANETPVTYDWSAVGFSMTNDASFDLKGNVLKIPASLLTDNSAKRTFTTSVAGGTLACDIASGIVTSSSTAIGAGVTLVKGGSGVLIWAHNDISAFCTVEAGVLKGGVNNGLFSTITVEQGATFDFFGSYNHTAMKILSRGGTLTTNVALNWNNGTFSELEITEDTVVTVMAGSQKNGGQCNGWGLNSGKKQVTLNGKKLIIDSPNNGTVFWLFGTTFTDAGTLEFRSGGYLCLHSSTINAPQLTFNHIGGSFIHNKDVTLANYYANCANDTQSFGSATFIVSGVFAPNLDRYMNTKLLNGATLDLSARTTPLSLTGTVSQNITRHLTFDSGAMITVDVHGREFTEQPTQLVAWSARPTGVDFVLEEMAKKQLCLKLESDGLYVAKRGPTVIYLR